MKKIIVILIAIAILTSMLFSDTVIAQKEREDLGILQGHCIRYNNQTNEWEPDAGAYIFVYLYSDENPSYPIGWVDTTVYSNYLVCNENGDFLLPYGSPTIFWRTKPDGSSYNINDVDYIIYTYHGKDFRANVEDYVECKFIQGY